MHKNRKKYLSEPRPVCVTKSTRLMSYSKEPDSLSGIHWLNRGGSYQSGSRPVRPSLISSWHSMDDCFLHFMNRECLDSNFCAVFST